MFCFCFCFFLCVNLIYYHITICNQIYLVSSYAIKSFQNSNVYIWNHNSDITWVSIHTGCSFFFFFFFQKIFRLKKRNHQNLSLLARSRRSLHRYNDVIMSAVASQITSLTIVYSVVYSGADQRKHQSSASLAFVWGIHRRPVHSPDKLPVTRKMFPFDDVIMTKRR